MKNFRASLLGPFRRFKEIESVYSVLLALKLTPLGKRLQERAAQLGYGLDFRPNRIVLRKGQREFWFAVRDPAQLWMVMPSLEHLVSRFVFVQQGRREIADLRGVQRYKIPGTTDFVRMAGLPEAADLQAGYFAQTKPQAGAVVFDCGAFCGEISIALARMVGPTGRVYSFEPDTTNRAQLVQNIAEAGLKNVTVVDKGLWKESTTLSFVSDGDLGSHLSNDSAQGKTVEVPVLSFEDACRLAGAVPSFVKMDIEGAEVEAVEGSLDFIAQQRIHFSIASYHSRNGQPTSSLLEPLFRRAGYRVSSGFPDHQTTWAERV